MKVNVISESAFTVQGHGVHSAFVDTVEALSTYTDWDVAQNSSRRADIIHIHTVGPYSLVKLIFRRGAKVVVSAHVTPDSFVGSLVGAKYWYGLAKWYLRWFYNRADGVLAVSQEVVGELKEMGVHSRVYLAPLMIRREAFATTLELRAKARAKFGLAVEDFVVLCIGQVQPRKGVESFVAAAQALPDLTFVWVGGMPFKKLGADSGVMGKLMRENAKNMRFVGMLARDVVVEWCHAADLFFLPSAQETFGVVIVEAAAAGLPVLLRDLDQYRTTFAGGYASGTNETFVDEIFKFAHDHKYYGRWQKAAETIAERYDSKAGAQNLVEIYGSVLGTR